MAVQFINGMQPDDDGKPLEHVATAEPIIGWRVWRVEKPQTLTLDAALADHLADVYERGGNPFKGLFGTRLGAVGQASSWNTASMAGHCNMGQQHDVPHRNCSCGIWSVKDKESLWPVIATYRKSGAPIAFGQVQMWGHWYEHAKGYRAQYARPYDVEVVGGDEATAHELRDFYNCDVRLIDEPEEMKNQAPAWDYSGGLQQFILTNINNVTLSGGNPYRSVLYGSPSQQPRQTNTFQELLARFPAGTFPVLDRATKQVKPARSTKVEWTSNKHRDGRGRPSVFKNYTQIFRTPFNPAVKSEKAALKSFLSDIERTLTNGDPNAQLEGGTPRRFCGGYRYYLGRELRKKDRLVLRTLREPVLRDTGSGIPAMNEWLCEISLEVWPA